MISELRERLEQVAKRFRRIRLWWVLSFCWLGLAIVAGCYAFWMSRQEQAWIPAAFITAWVMIAWVLIAQSLLLARRSARDTRWVAKQIEARYPDLKAGLLAAVDQAEGPPSRRLGYLESSVVREAVAHSRSHDWGEVVSSRSFRLAKLAHVASLLLMLAATVWMGSFVRSKTLGFPPPDDRELAGSRLLTIKVDPGNAEIEKGSPLLVIAKFDGAVPADASLIVNDDKEGAGPVRAMTRSLEDPTFAARVESVDTNLNYRVDFAGQSSETYKVNVFEYPAVRRTDARLVYPQYTSLDVKVVEDIRHVTLLEGTELTLICHLNKPVNLAQLADPEGQTIDLKPSPGSGTNTYEATFTPIESKRYKIQLTDLDRRSNKQAYEIAIHVTRNNAPVVKTIQPSRDVRVSPVEELALKAQIEDDFGVTRLGLSYSFGGAEPKEMELKGESINDKSKAKGTDEPNMKATKPAPKNRKLRAELLLDFESMKAVPDQLVTYFFWAEDVGPDGKPRRTDGDMFFAEVRHFEEIFRQGEAPSASAEMEMQGQQGQNAQQSDKLAELQKEIINGTWKLIRRETGAKPTETFGADSKVLEEAQQSAIEQAGELEGRLRDEKSKLSLAIAVKAMHEAEAQLSEAAKGTSTTALRPALAAEQSAYQALLKLRAREFEVVRGNRQRGQRGGGGGGGASQQQLNQLDLNDEQNKYEEQRSARAQQENLTKQQQEQRESRQVLSRLRELAQRQGDLNARLKEMQSALEAAKDQQAKAEIERQLKRLREQQEEILRDTDELRERMENEQNRQRMAEARNEIEQGREHVRQAAEALEKGSLPQAITEGARAGQKLDELKEEMRKDSANRFSEQVTDMRDRAKQLDEKQEKLSQQLEAQEQTAQRSLRGSDDRKQTRQELEQQQKQLEQILNRMQETVAEAEETEPRLAEELFDTIRKANDRMLPEALKETDRLVDMGIAEEAAKSSRRAGEGIDELRQGIERASRSVLGDEAAALRLAQQELKDLSDQVEREIAQGTVRPGQPQQQGQGGQGQQPRQQGQQGPEEQQEGRQQGQGGQGGQGQNRQQDQLGQGQQQGQEGQNQQQGQQGQAQQPGQRGGQRGGGLLRGGNPTDAQRDGPGGQGSAVDRLADGLDRGGLPRWGSADGPITGEGFRQWADRMRDVEELIEDAQLRAEAARIRDRVRGTREDYKRHSKAPDWSKLQDLVANPMNELRKRIAEEVRRRESPDSLVPIDRDPVPPQFAEGVRRYYERLGSGQ